MLDSRECAIAQGSRTAFKSIECNKFPLRGKTGQEWIRTIEGVSQRIYSPPRLATSVPTRFYSIIKMMR